MIKIIFILIFISLFVSTLLIGDDCDCGTLITKHLYSTKSEYTIILCASPVKTDELIDLYSSFDKSKFNKGKMLESINEFKSNSPNNIYIFIVFFCPKNESDSLNVANKDFTNNLKNEIKFGNFKPYSLNEIFKTEMKNAIYGFYTLSIPQSLYRKRVNAYIGANNLGEINIRYGI